MRKSVLFFDSDNMVTLHIPIFVKRLELVETKLHATDKDKNVSNQKLECEMRCDREWLIGGL